MNKNLKPIIKFNGGEPVALCNKCSAIMCYVSCREDDGEFCRVKEIRNLNGKNYISTKIGEPPPPYCDACNTLYNYSLNE